MLGARVNLYVAARKWDMVVAVAIHLVKVDPKTPGWWISLAYALNAAKALRRPKPFCFGRKRYIPKLP